jgi:hypothetical protein
MVLSMVNLIAGSTPSRVVSGDHAELMPKPKVPKGSLLGQTQGKSQVNHESALLKVKQCLGVEVPRWVVVWVHGVVTLCWNVH